MSRTRIEFDVFLSFRGPDTKNFTYYLYHTLVRAGICVFRDYEDIRMGGMIVDELLHAIESSNIYMPIFSRSYVFSAWCLRELTHMVKCSSNANDKVILPIFYDVNSDDVKLSTPLYLDALEMHEEKFGHENVQRWREALTEVARIEGWGLQEKGHGEIIGCIVYEVLTKLKNRRRRILSHHLVGIHHHVEAIMNLLREGSPDVRYLVIYGMIGIGKTTLASVVFNQIFNQFEVCSFLSDIRETALHGGIRYLQDQLLSQLRRGKSLEIHHSVDAGIAMISKRFRDKKVLLVLDDLNEWDQLSKIAGKSDWFGPGSKIIITTQNINFFPIKEVDKENSSQANSEEYKFYEMTEMDSLDALQLFSRHAFMMDFPPDDFDDISGKIISETGGLPLALRVIGSILCRKREVNWKEMKQMLHFKCTSDVYYQLRICYNMLNCQQREIFLDIACFFNEKERLQPYYMWEACNFYPQYELDVLIRMSFIKIGENDTLWMHNQFRKFGREIVQREDNFPGKRSRLWEPRIAFNVVRMKEGTDNVVALRLSGLTQEYNFTSEEFSKMPNLRFLELEGGNLVGDFKNLLSELIWFSWSNCPSELNAKNLCLEKLVVLELSGNNITEEWAGWGPCLVSKDLKVIQITQCPNLRRTPDVSKCSKLERLVLQGGKTSLVVDGSLSRLVVYGFCQD